ncbi:MAG: hypothetical protein IKP66_00920 [Lachnospiraceae bacterium]|nr:hypothetical protein [Lachnospiraceae bacterium]
MLLKLLSILLLGLSGNSSTQNNHKRNFGHKSTPGLGEDDDYDEEEYEEDDDNDFGDDDWG